MKKDPSHIIKRLFQKAGHVQIGENFTYILYVGTFQTKFYFISLEEALRSLRDRTAHLTVTTHTHTKQALVFLETTTTRHRFPSTAQRVIFSQTSSPVSLRASFSIRFSFLLSIAS